ncbi:SF1B family DNA helicase RecD2 [Paracraurococcus ruber]|uniref:ATP-dependent RecD2 DNA helicase n=1 Tax=Paracraurococcus ruber TaxID=77675 RepID=A0ABS1D3S8_9PROT|nr:ATP-dependent RecD-like DNA helicase [Paracraurococcus ruber]MBK1661515.1 ATP-dependent RecD-like DNA helicase [Paracraurococcus ruber]TDG19767.1 ATP-dependent RecD-like DNA helicase [Paracraurococcus ruber]
MPVSPALPAPAAAAALEVLAGLVERVTFHNAENGFCVLRVKARGRRDLVTVVGHAAAISAGEWVNAGGEWVNDREHGQQFRARFLRTSAPTTAEGMRRYLASGMIRGIGPAYAGKLVGAFGEAVFEVIEASPERLREVPGIGPVRAGRIVAAWAEQKMVREIMVFLHQHGVGTSRAVRIFRTYGAEAIRVMTDNPYRLARDIRGIGFRTADAIAERLGIARDALIRVRAGISYALSEATNEGHCGLPRAELVTLAGKLLEVPAELIGMALAFELAEGSVVADTVGEADCVFLAGLYRAERAIADRLLALRRGAPSWGAIDAERAMPWVAARIGLELAPSQAEAVRMALAAKVLVITGGPGVGKTTIVRAILRILAAKGVRMLLAAPTGRAAKRLTEATGLEARTLHRLLEADPAKGGFRRDADTPLDCDLVVVDEASMVDVPLANALLRAVPDRAALLVVGDVDQLPSVGPGQVLADLIGSGALPVVRLTEVFRQAAASRIVVNAHRINRGLMPELERAAPESDFHFVPAEDPETALARIVELVGTRIPRRYGLDPIRDVQVLCPMQRGGVGARSLNIALQAALNPAGEAKVERFGWSFAPGDKVMQLDNDYEREVFNGDLGLVEAVDLEAGEVAVGFDGRTVTYGLGELDALAPAYAVTIHKSQGSEYPAVVIPVLTQHYAMLQRNLLYTGVTRGKRLVVLVGQPRAVAIAVRGVAGRQRWSKLREWLADRSDALA